MGSEDAEVQCQTQSASASVPCESAASYGIATVPFVASVSVAPNRTASGTPVTASAVMLAHSAASHTPPQNVAVQPSVAASPLPHVQVIQQPLQNQYLQHVYAPQQQHMFLPGNLTIQPAIQSIGGTQGISLQLQGKAMENKTGTPTIISAPMQSMGTFGTQSLLQPGNQIAGKACISSQMLAASSKSTAVIQGQSNFIPATTANQTVVIGQLGVLSNPQAIIPHQKALTEGQKGKSYLISQPTTLHPKSPILPSPNVSCAGQMIATSQLKQLPSTPHIITTQAPTMIASQAQILGSLQALGASLPPGLTWATPGSLHSPALFGQNPIFIRSQQSDMFIQSPSPQATIHAVPVQPAPQLQQAQQQTQQAQQMQQPQQALQPQPVQQQIQVQQQVQQSQQIQQASPQQQQQQSQQQQQTQQQIQQIQPAQQIQLTQQQQTQQHQIVPAQATTPQQQVQQQQQTQHQQTQHQQTQHQQTQPQQIQQQQTQQQQTQHQQTQHQQTQHQQTQHQQIQLSQPTQQIAIQPQPTPPQPIAPTPSSTPVSQVFKVKTSVRPGCSIATQTSVSTSTSGLNSTSTKTMSKNKSRLQSYRTVQANAGSNSANLQTATTQTQTQPAPSQKADAANQTKPAATEIKLAATYNKILEPFKSAATESAYSPGVQEPIEIEIAQTNDISETALAPDVAIVAPSPAIPLVDEGIQMEMDEPVPSSSPALPETVPFEKVAPSRKEVELDNVGIVMPMTESTNREKHQPQKAIVKPHVLTHVIEGFVIQEGSEPFPVTMPSYSIIAKDDTEKHGDNYNNISNSDASPPMKKKEKIPKIRGGPIELAKCEFCGKLGPKAKFKRSKRFCSTSCAKRFNAGSSKRLAIILPEQGAKNGEEVRRHKKKGSKKGGKSKKKKLGLKSKKSWKRSENAIYEEKEWTVAVDQEMPEENVEEEKVEMSVSAPEQNEEVPDMEVEGDSNEPLTPEEEESRPPTPTFEPVEEEQSTISHNTEFATKSPLKWTVTDVVDFVRDMPGCSDYADEFRSQEIDGQALLLLKEDHLMSLMSMKLGPALKVCARINSMRDEVSH